MKIKKQKDEEINIHSLKNHKKFIRNTTLILKTQQIFKNERHNVFTEDINEIARG